MPSLSLDESYLDPELGAEYIRDYELKYNLKWNRSLKRAKFLFRKTNGGRLLDVGSNVGIFVDAAQRIGFDAVGLELEKSLIEYARQKYPNYKFFHSALEEFEVGEKYSVAYCSEVIEHVRDPLAFVKKIRSLLNPGGVLFLTTPDITEYMNKCNIVRNLGAPDHKLYFSRSNIGTFLKAAGFTDVWHKPALRRKGIRVLAR